MNLEHKISKQITDLLDFATQLSLSARAIALSSICAWLSFGTASPPNVQAQELQSNTQHWQGVLDVGSAMLTLKVEIVTANNTYSATVYSVDQGNAPITVDEIKVTKEIIRFELNAIKASFVGTLNAQRDICKGTFTQNGKKFDLALNLIGPEKHRDDELIEFWKGTLVLDGKQLEMGLKVFRVEDGSLAAKLSSYSQGVTDLPVEFEKTGNEYQFKFPAAKLEFAGTLTDKTISGTIKQGRSENKLEFVQTDFDAIPARLHRPQTPKRPYPYKSIDVKYKNSKQEVTLGGTLTIPYGDGPFPVAITISGSGASDRDASHFEHKPFHVIADYLAHREIAVLRFDDRGRGDSTGDYSGATSADLATDVEAGIEFLKTFPNVDARKLGLIGHSEGGLIAPMIAAQRDDVHFIVMLAGTGVNGGIILQSQSSAILKANGCSEKKLKANRDAHGAILSLIEKAPQITHEQIKAAGQAYVDSIEDPKTKKLIQKSVVNLVAVLKSKWVRFFVRHEPIEPLAKVKCHALAMNGEKDLQVLCDLNLGPIEKALRSGSPKSYKIVRLPNVNHMFQETNGTGSPEEYGNIEQSISPKVLEIIGDWITDVSKK